MNDPTFAEFLRELNWQFDYLCINTEQYDLTLYRSSNSQKAYVEEINPSGKYTSVMIADDEDFFDALRHMFLLWIDAKNKKYI